MSLVSIGEEKNSIEMHNMVYKVSKINMLTPELCTVILSHMNVSEIQLVNYLAQNHKITWYVKKVNNPQIKGKST